MNFNKYEASGRTGGSTKRGALQSTRGALQSRITAGRTRRGQGTAIAFKEQVFQTFEKRLRVSHGLQGLPEFSAGAERTRTNTSLGVASLCVPADCLAARSVTHLMKGLSARLLLKVLLVLFVVGLAKAKEEDYYKVRYFYVRMQIQ